jgi:hypothetical protein
MAKDKLARKSVSSLYKTGSNFFHKVTMYTSSVVYKKNAVLLHAMVALGGRGGIAPTHS